MRRRQAVQGLVAFGVALSTAVIAAPGASADPGPTPGGGARHLPRVPHHGTVDQRLAAARGPVTAFVQLDATAAAQVAEQGGSPAAVQAARSHTQAVAQDVVPAAITPQTAGSAQVKRLGTTTNLVAGTLVSGDAAQVRGLASDPNVVAIYRVTPKKLDNAHSDGFVRAVQAWSSAHATGKGVRVAVIDTGLDYTHADFGGPGTAQAYALADADAGTHPIPAGSFDPAKFLGGYDFAGPHYTADPARDGIPGATDVPAPDGNPIDAFYTGGNDGHGTHVAGTAAGYGVDPSGATFRGDYTQLTDVSSFKIGPGSAPQAGLYSFKVFGDSGGSTTLDSLALDRAADPNQDGKFDDRVDVVNLSLGSDGAPADEADNVLIDRLTALGTLVVAAAGNGGDVQDVAGSPGNAQSALSVANSVGAPQTYDGVEVTAPANLAGKYAAQNSISYTGADVTAPVAMPDPANDKVDGCPTAALPDGFTPEQKARIAGKIAYLYWDDDDSTRVCGSKARFDAAAAAGAVGVLLPTANAVFAAGIAGDTKIPGAQLTRSATTTLAPAIAAGTVTAHIGPSLAGSVVQDLAGDVLNPSSSRGDHGSLGRSSPDVAAPGTQIVSAAAGAGAGSHSLTGTSMATPLVVGIAADVRQAHPTWDPSQVKAAIENTATHDVTTEPNGGGLVYGPQRTGSGRVDALSAVTTNAIAFDSDRPTQVGVTFGVVPVGGAPVRVTRTVTVRNFDARPLTYATSVTRATTEGGARITASPSRVRVPAGGTAKVTLTLTADPRTIRREIDPTMAQTQLGVPREYVAQVTGRLVLTSGASQLRVPVQAAPRLVSSLTARPVILPPGPAAAAGTLTITGNGFARPDGWVSLATPLVLGATSPKLPPPGSGASASAWRSGDIRYVGWASNVPSGVARSAQELTVGIATDGDWASLGQADVPVIDIDVNGDGTPELETLVEKYSPSTDITVADTYDYATGELLDTELVNDLAGDTDAGVFDNSVLVAPIWLDAAGIPANAKPKITVSIVSGYAGNATSGVVDTAPTFTADLTTPPYWFDAGYQGTGSFAAAGSTSIAVHHTAGTPTPPLLVLEHANATPDSRAQVVRVTALPKHGHH